MRDNCSRKKDCFIVEDDSFFQEAKQHPEWMADNLHTNDTGNREISKKLCAAIYLETK